MAGSHLSMVIVEETDQSGSFQAEGDSVVIASPYHDENGLNDVGAAYVFTRASNHTWDQTFKLVAEGLGEGCQFGWGLSISVSTKTGYDGHPAALGIGARYITYCFLLRTMETLHSLELHIAVMEELLTCFCAIRTVLGTKFRT